MKSTIIIALALGALRRLIDVLAMWGVPRRAIAHAATC
jgi:hypothetical protein